MTFLWIWSIPIAFLLDLVCGDPAWLPHPVRWIGRWASFCERFFRKGNHTGVLAGFVFWLFIVIPSAGIPLAILFVADIVHPWLARALEIWMIYQGIALRDLIHEVRNIFKALQANELHAARIATSRIVSRSTANMDEAALSRSAIESASENGVDGVISPLFWTFLLGPAGLWAFKAASTLDSMVGYRTPAYETFGKFSARVDDVLNWIPARLSLLLYSLSAFPKFSQMLQTFHIGWRDHNLHTSPNSGWGEAAAAGFLGARLGGPAVYHGVLKEKPWFGREFRDVNKNDILRTIYMVFAASILFLCGIVLFLRYVQP